MVNIFLTVLCILLAIIGKKVLKKDYEITCNIYGKQSSGKEISNKIIGDILIVYFMIPIVEIWIPEMTNDPTLKATKTALVYFFSRTYFHKFHKTDSIK